LILALLGAVLLHAGAPVRATVRIGSPAKSFRYSRMIFGGFIEHFHRQVYGGLFDPGSPLSDERGFRKDVIAAVRELKTAIVRWPGGCFASGYHWRNGVGRDRKPVADPVWGVIEPNTFGTDEFVLWCKRAGCEPYICANAGNGTPEEMRNWVAYCNARTGAFARLRSSCGHPEPFGVHFWSIGNENWGAHEIGAKTPRTWGPFVRRCAELMLQVDPTVTLLAAATPNRNWTLPLLKEAGRYLSYVCIHKYWLGFWQHNKMPSYRSCIMLSEGPEATIKQVIALLDEAGCRGRIKIAFDEWNLRGWHHPGFPRKKVSDPNDPETKALIEKRDLNAVASQYTMADALFAASFLNSCLRHGRDVGMANIAPLVNTRGPIYVHARGIVKRTTFHTLALYATKLKEKVVPIELKTDRLREVRRSVGLVDALATVDAAGESWALSLVNRHPDEAVNCRVLLEDRPLEGEFSAAVLQGDSPEAFNDIAHPNRVAPEFKRLKLKKGLVLLPPHSLTILSAEHLAR